MNLRPFWIPFLWASVSGAGILLNPEQDAIHVTDYPPDAPCTLARIRAVDRAFGWGRVAYDADRNVTTVAGNLMIGAHDGLSPTHKLGSDTVLRIGSATDPHETLVMRGNLYVMPYWVEGENPGTYWGVPRKLNALVLGDPTNAAFRGALKFACSAQDRFTLYCGRMPWIQASQFGGGVYAYHSEISALHPGPDARIGDARRGDVYLYGSVVLDHARVADVKGGLAGMHQAPKLKEYRLRDTVFEQIGAVLVNGVQAASQCRFVRCGTAVLDQGGLRAELSECVFQGNERNWALGYTGQLTLVDCEWEVPAQGDLVRVWVNPDGRTQYPRLRVRRHVVVEVTDRADNPVPNASVAWRVEQEARDERPSQLHKTGPDGRTPGPGMPDALALTAYVSTAAEGAPEPDTESYTYSITATQGGRTATVTRVAPDASWKRIPLTIE